MGVTPEFIQGELARAKSYTVVYLKAGPRYEDHPERDAIQMAHVVRNFEMKADGPLAIVGPMRTEGDVVGMYVFDCSLEEASALIDGDPGVQAGLFVFEAQTMMAFPGDTLP